MSGIFLQTDKPLPVGTLGRLLLVLRCGEDRIKIHAECRVVRIVADACDRPRGMGLEYTNLDSDSSIALYNVVRYQGGIEEHDHENK